MTYCDSPEAMLPLNRTGLYVGVLCRWELCSLNTELIDFSTPDSKTLPPSTIYTVNNLSCLWQSYSSPGDADINLNLKVTVTCVCTTPTTKNANAIAIKTGRTTERNLPQGSLRLVAPTNFLRPQIVILVGTHIYTVDSELPIQKLSTSQSFENLILTDVARTPSACMNAFSKLSAVLATQPTVHP
ncbi:hypothetical protein BGY98DRAFT_539015 [Russula aff. rugulosa BPL654]|nr:hypothetical protein BGY98DRAFT_539015 [Russula aff. rugulosa BPL654]